MPSPADRWLDKEAGPVVRPYAVIRGRTRPTGTDLDLIALVTAVRGTRARSADLGPEHYSILRLSRLPVSVADLASDLDLPVGVIRVLIADLRDLELVTVHNPTPPARLLDPRILREVVDGLRRL
jgi:hypothetical protein